MRTTSVPKRIGGILARLTGGIRGLCLAHQVTHDENLQTVVVACFLVALPLLPVDARREFHQAQEDFLAVSKVLHGDVMRLGAHRFDVQANDFPVGAVIVADEDVDAVEGATEIDTAEALVLVILKTILVVEMNSPEFSVP